MKSLERRRLGWLVKSQNQLKFKLLEFRFKLSDKGLEFQRSKN